MKFADSHIKEPTKWAILWRFCKYTLVLTLFIGAGFSLNLIIVKFISEFFDGGAYFVAGAGLYAFIINKKYAPSPIREHYLKIYERGRVSRTTDIW